MRHNRDKGRAVRVRRSRAPRPRPPRRVALRATRLLLLVGLVLFAVALVLAFDVVRSPPPPDLAALAPAGLTADVPPAATKSAAVRPRSAQPSAPSLSEPPAPPADDAATMGTTAEPALRWRPPRAGRPRLAVVIDDLGRSVAILDQLAEIGVPLTYSVLPYESRTAEVVAHLAARGDEILCHLPMEARGGVSAGPGALRRDMSPAELIAATERALAAVPGAVGANNHMGSEISADAEAMRAVLEVLAGRGLYFLDSRTSADTRGYTVARQLAMAAGERQVFLDVERDPAYIRRQLAEAVALARENGAAIAIAHPYPETLQVLAEYLPLAHAQGVDLVRASELLGG